MWAWFAISSVNIMDLVGCEPLDSVSARSPDGKERLVVVCVDAVAVGVVVGVVVLEPC